MNRIDDDVVATPRVRDVPADFRARINYRWPRSIDAELGRAIIDLYNDSIRTEDVLGFTSALTPEQGRAVTMRLDEAVRRGDKHFFGIYADDRLIGMALLTPNSLPNCRHIVEWSKGIIHSSYRGRGVLQPTLLVLAERCREMGWDIITLDVRAESRSHRTWSLFGFKEYGRLADYARIDGKSQAGVYMFATIPQVVQAAGTRRGFSN